MSSDRQSRDAERERLERDAARVGFVEVRPGYWVRASAILTIEARGDGSLVGVRGAKPEETDLTPPQLLRVLVVLGGEGAVSAEGDYATLHRIANDLHKSRLFKTGSVEQALAVILMGRELGIGPTTALSNIVIAAGKPTLGASLVGALIQKSGRYTYQVTEMTDQRVSIDFYETARHFIPGGPSGENRKLGTSTFTLQDAQRARLSGSQTWQQYPRNLLLARALTNGARWYTPEVFGGAIYDPEELGVSGILAPPEGGQNATGSVPGLSPSEGAADAVFVPDGDGLTIEAMLEVWTAEDILGANGGQLPGTDEELRRVARALRERDQAGGTGRAVNPQQREWYVFACGVVTGSALTWWALRAW